MSAETSKGESMMIELKGNSYPCHKLERNGRVFFQVVFKTSHLYLTKATGADRLPFWTSIPADPKLNHIVMELGQQIEKYFK